MSRITIPLYYCKSRVPLVMFKLQGDAKYIGIIDTGSEISMFDPTLTDDGLSVVSNSETSFVGVNGESGTSNVIQVKGDIYFKTKDKDTCSVGISGVEYDFGGLTRVFQERFNKQISISAIFGSDFLKGYNAKIDFKNKTLTIDC